MSLIERHNLKSPRRQDAKGVKKDLVPDSFASGRFPGLAALLDAIVESLVVALLVFMPFALGVVAPWSEAIVVATVTLIALCLMARAVVLRGRSCALSWALVPVGLFLALCAVQLLPLPARVAGAISPHTRETKTQLLQDLPDAAAELRFMTLSFYPAATRHDLRIALAFSVLFLAALQVYRHERQVVRLLWAVVLIGGAAAVLALLQDVSSAERIYWLIPTPRAQAIAGPFVNYNNYSQYINLCVGAALGLLLYRLRSEAEMVDGRLTRPDWQMQGLKTRGAWLLIAIIILGSVTLFLSLSRGGMLSLLFASGFTALMLARRRGVHGAGWALMGILLAVFAGLLYTGFDAVCERLATLKNSSDPSSGRIQTYKDIGLAWRQFPLLGMGLGTHEYVYPMFDRSSNSGLADYADSDYFQMAEEAGAAGIALTLTFAAFLWVAYARATRSRTPRVNVIAYGLGFGLLAVMVQSMTDYGQHLPAIGGITALFAGLLITLSRSPLLITDGFGSRRPERIEGTSPQAAGTPFLARLAVPGALAALMVGSCLGAEAAWQSRLAADRAVLQADRLESFDWQGTDADFGCLLTEATAAVDADPGNIKARYLLATYRWHCASRSLEAGTPTQDPASAPEPAVTNVQAVLNDLAQTRIACPTFGPAYAVQGQIERLILNLPIGSAHVRTAVALAPADPQVCFAAGQLDAAEGKWDESLQHFRRCLDLDVTFLPQITELYLHRVDRPALAVAVVQDNPQGLFEVYHRLRDEVEVRSDPAAYSAMDSARQTLEAVAERPTAPGWVLISLAGLFKEQKDYGPATLCYRKAIQKEYGQADWHLALASTLAESGHNDEAIHEAEICLHLRPENLAARQFIQKANAQVTTTEQVPSPNAEMDEGRSSHR